jgi:hypothetical protein
MPRDSFERRSDEWEDEKPERPYLRILLQRSWVLVVPLIALGWYSSHELAPLTKSLDAKIDSTHVVAEGQRNKTLTDARRLEANVSLLKAIDDTFAVRFSSLDSRIDSVTVQRDAEMKDYEWLNSRADSLRRTFAQTEKEWNEIAKKLPPLTSSIESLNRVIASRDSVVHMLEAAKQADADSTDRVLRPNLYRKNSALVTGAGDFPNRDALPKR